MQLILFICFIFYNSTCFGRSPRPSSGVAATTVCKQITPEDGRGLRPKRVEL